MKQALHSKLENTCFALLPNTNSIASITFDLPLPLGPTTDVKDCSIHRDEHLASVAVLRLVK